MLIAVTYENGNIFQHFGKTENFKLYDVRDNAVIDSRVIGTNGNSHGELAGFLKSQGVDVLICGGIGEGAQEALNEMGIKFFAGVNGDSDNAVKNFLANKLEFDSNPHCDNDNHNHDHAHSCKE